MRKSAAGFLLFAVIAAFSAAAPAFGEPLPPAASASRPSLAPLISSVRIEKDGVRITFTEAVPEFATGDHAAPARLEIDIPGAANGTEMASVALNRFGVASVLLSSRPEGVKLVFQGAKKHFPEYRVDRDVYSLKVVFTRNSE